MKLAMRIVVLLRFVRLAFAVENEMHAFMFDASDFEMDIEEEYQACLARRRLSNSTGGEARPDPVCDAEREDLKKKLEQALQDNLNLRARLDGDELEDRRGNKVDELPNICKRAFDFSFVVGLSTDSLNAAKLWNGMMDLVKSFTAHFPMDDVQIDRPPDKKARMQLIVYGKGSELGAKEAVVVCGGANPGDFGFTSDREIFINCVNRLKVTDKPDFESRFKAVGESAEEPKAAFQLLKENMPLERKDFARSGLVVVFMGDQGHDELVVEEEAFLRATKEGHVKPLQQSFPGTKWLTCGNVCVFALGIGDESEHHERTYHQMAEKASFVKPTSVAGARRFRHMYTEDDAKGVAIILRLALCTLKSINAHERLLLAYKYGQDIEMACDPQRTMDVFQGRKGGTEILDNGEEVKIPARVGFFEVLQRWEMIASMAQRLKGLPDPELTKAFCAKAREPTGLNMFSIHYSDSQSPLYVKELRFLEQLKTAVLSIRDSCREASAFKDQFAKFMDMVLAEVQVEWGMELSAEYEYGMEYGGLRIAVAAGSEEYKRKTQTRAYIASNMVDWQRNAEIVEFIVPVFQKAQFDKLWSAWEHSQGAIRVYAKITTQCRPGTHPTLKASSSAIFKAFFSKPAHKYWNVCKDAPLEKWSTSWWPSAVVGCARQDEYKRVLTGGNPETNVDAFIRYLGCGTNRMKDNEPHVEQPRGYRKLCFKTDMDEEHQAWYNAMCNKDSDVIDPATDPQGACRIFGPFWAVYSHKASSLFGLKPFDEVTSTLDAATTKHKEVIEEIDQNYKDRLNGASATAGADCIMKYSPEAGEQCSDPQSSAFKGMVNNGNALYIYGKLPPLPRPRAFAGGASFTIGWDQQKEKKEWPLPHERIFDPPLSHVMYEIKSGATIMLMAYGFSGAGKTTTLVGDISIKGIISIYFSEMKLFIDDMDIWIAEIYGRMDPLDGRMVPGVGQGLWGFEITGPDSVVTQFYGGWEDYRKASDGSDDSVDFDKVTAKLAGNAGSMAMKLYQGKDNKPEEAEWDKELLKILGTVEKARKRADEFTSAGPKAMAHIRATPNNPTSSRGTLFVHLDLKYLETVADESDDDVEIQKEGSIIIVDLAGSEDPTTMVSAFFEFIKPADDVEAPNIAAAAQRRVAQVVCEDIVNARTDAELKAASMTMVKKNLHRLNDGVRLNQQMGECLKFRDFIFECADKNEKGCSKTYVYGKDRYFRVDMEADEAWIAKTVRYCESTDPVCQKFTKDFHFFPSSEDVKLMEVEETCNGRNCYKEHLAKDLEGHEGAGTEPFGAMTIPLDKVLRAYLGDGSNGFPFTLSGEPKLKAGGGFDFDNWEKNNGDVQKFADALKAELTELDQHPGGPQNKEGTRGVLPVEGELRQDIQEWELTGPNCLLGDCASAEYPEKYFTCIKGQVGQTSYSYMTAFAGRSTALGIGLTGTIKQPVPSDVASKRRGKWTQDPVKCPIFTCTKVNLEEDGVQTERVLDHQLEIIDRDLWTGNRVPSYWRLNYVDPSTGARMDAGAGGGMPQVLDVPPEIENPTNPVVCDWPDLLFHSMGGDLGTEAIYEKLATAQTKSSKVAKWQKCMAANCGSTDDRAKKWWQEKGNRYKGYNFQFSSLKILYWRELQKYLDEFRFHEEKYREQFDEKLAYFSQVIGPMVEEALYINEMLNQMKQWLVTFNTWAQVLQPRLEPWPNSLSDLDPTIIAGLRANLGEKTKIKIDADKGDADEDGCQVKVNLCYDKAKLIEPKDQDETYYEEVRTKFVDKVMGATIFDFLRRRANRPERNAHPALENKLKILFGAFIRSDIPNGDAACTGAQMSLDFSQKLLGMMRKTRLKFITGYAKVS
eukprot:gnl/MRDRNA2_/MRDRNA2_124126_c0_seq1.p1 gnl/MRDRNA2_/MRDRNA2_124126_c0~~gnl/MRDRNA2_/MRDRNA2_124126_c0_seq1.p1  ORF type:complete len:1845 (+),score=309.40 gnl/MRDRNA2_/MRDRNA2_124126_c0_seq1:152-5686(+)